MVISLEPIYNCAKKYQLVIAGAGGGKTHTLIHTLARRIKEGKIKPKEHKVIVFTFTNNAADELVVKLSILLGKNKDILNNIFVGTIHGWCKEFLSEDYFLSNTKVINELEQFQLIQRIYPLLGIERAYTKGNKFDKIELFSSDLELFYNENLELSDSRISTQVRNVLNNYLTFIETERFVDFGSLIRRAIKAIKDNLYNEPVHVFIDEYQDINNAQAQLIKNLVSKNIDSTLFAVGDPRQSIYQWRGGDINRILNFPSDFKSAEIFNLIENRRSRPGIVNFANIISLDMDLKSSYKIENMIVHQERNDNNISVIGNVYSLNHEESIVKLITGLHKEGIDYSDIAILMRSVISNGEPLMHLLSTEKIPFYSPNQNKGTIFIQRFMLAIIELMKIISAHQPQNKDEEDERIYKIDSLLQQILAYSKSKKGIIHVAIAQWYKLLSVPNKYDKKQKIYTFENEQYNFRKQLFEFCEKIQFTINEQEHEIQEGFAAITQIMKAIEEVYRRRFSKSKNYRDSPIHVFINNLQWNIDVELEKWTEVGMGLYKGKGVTISTVHAAKGLEWPIVIIPFLWKNKFPLRQSYYDTSIEGDFKIKYGTTFSDEQRLWYVAVTRARDRLYYFASQNENHKTSPFIDINKLNNEPKGYIILDREYSKTKVSDVIHHENAYYFTLGVSNFLLLLECPYHFYLRYLIGVDVPVGKELGAGDIIHKVISRLKKEGETKINAIIDEEVYLPLGEIEDEKIIGNSIKKKSVELLKSSLLNSVEETEYPFTLLLGNLVVLGILDASRQTKNGLEIIDWKSNIHKEFLKRYTNQILVYSKGLIELSYKVSHGSIYDLSDINKKPVEIVVNDDEINKIFSEAKSIISGIMTDNVKAVPSESSCMICDVSKICPKNCFKSVSK